MGSAQLLLGARRVCERDLLPSYCHVMFLSPSPEYLLGEVGTCKPLNLSQKYGRANPIFFSVWRGYISEVTCHRRYTIKKTHPNLTAQVENIGGKINYRATFIYHLTRQDQTGKGPACGKMLPIFYTNLVGYIYAYLQKGFFFREK